MSADENRFNSGAASQPDEKKRTDDDKQNKTAKTADNAIEDVNDVWIAKTMWTMNGVASHAGPVINTEPQEFDDRNVSNESRGTIELSSASMSSSDPRRTSDVARYRRGCLLLGTDHTDGSGSGSESGSDVRGDEATAATYLTRYGIDHTEQAKGLCSEVILDDCAPCCRGCFGEEQEDNRKTGRMMLTFGVLVAAIRSEVFLYTLHVTSIVLGAVKEGVGLRQTDNTLNLIQSAVETSATLLLIVIRMFNAYLGYRRVKWSLEHVVHYDEHSPYCNGASCRKCRKGRRGPEEVHIRLIRQWMIVQLAAGLVLFSISLGCFMVFLNYVHLGWTILSNNFCMITITMLSSLYAARVTVAVTRIIEDIHKVVIYDSQLIISVMHTTATSDTDECSCTKTRERDDTTDNVMDTSNDLASTATATVDGLRFVNAVDHTKLFIPPSYITYCGDNLRKKEQCVGTRQKSST